MKLFDRHFFYKNINITLSLVEYT